MSDADKAYEAAQAKIEEARKAGKTQIWFDVPECFALRHIPTEIADFTVLTHVGFDNTCITDLSPLSPLTGLQYLSLNQTGVTDISPLSPLIRLQNLYLTKTGVTDLAPLSPLTGLQFLSLSETGVTNLAPISRLIELKRLDLGKTGIKDVHPLKSLTNLQMLWLNETTVEDINPLETLTSLQILSLNSTKVSDLRPLGDQKNTRKNRLMGVAYRNTPATACDADLALLSEIENPEVRAFKTRAYLRSLPPWPEPYTPRATPDGSPPQPIGGGADNVLLPKVRTSEVQIRNLLRHALVTRVTAAQLSEQITDALRHVPATNGNELAPPLQMMAEIAEVLSALAQDDAIDAGRERDLRLRIHHLEAIIKRLTQALKDEQQARAAAEALAMKDGFWQSYRKSLGIAAGAGTIGVMGVGVPTAAVYFLGLDHPLVQAFLTVMGRLPKG
ncbi:leucine rich repeat protein [Roseovarius sp. TM1035]|jgi:hypothetical protein|uniref:leucine-rich repeat domain-containing protein n=1 Tax=Roseovarius sp. TM1035 TaxID=391613 RepID=UPI000155687A|nr:leucine-rich repeat domain-containing protein [Roseovarius sp. TM1035]AWZ21052.1 Internalin, putative [Roseovarius sp. AK1035]EDM32930.1 leucine rich repeat protein [Roseovarius sp. TM1035]